MSNNAYIRCLLFILMIFSISKIYPQNMGRFTFSATTGINYENGNKKYDGTTVANYEITNLNFRPDFGYFVTENFSLRFGVLLSYGRDNETSDVEYNFYNESLSVAFLPEARYYFGKNRLKPYLQFSTGPIYRSNTNLVEGIEIDKSIFSGIAIEGIAGIEALMSDKIALNASFSFDHFSMQHYKDPKMKIQSNSGGLNFGVTINF